MMNEKEAKSRAITAVVFGLEKHEIGSESNSIQLAYLHAMIDECQKRAASIEQPEIHQRLISWIEKRGGKATAREVQRDFRPRPATAEAAYKLLRDIVRQGVGRMELIQPHVGRPVDTFILNDSLAALGLNQT